MDAVWQVLGGLGLFLLGMVVMTDALRELAGSALTRGLRRFTRSPFTGALTGAGATALVQSSSATTLAAVGFAGAGLLSFSQALGIVFGANIGTTVTGWLVALVGFKLKIGSLALPLVPLGMALRLLGRGRVAPAGLAIAGFGLIFVGIGVLQQGMAGFEGVVTPDHFPSDTLLGRALLVGIGIGITVVTQSSSAGVATALAAVAAGTIDLPQAAALVIGMDVGTTFTAALAAAGGSLAARRTGFAHVIYNLLTAMMAFALVTPYLALIEAVLPGASASDPALVLVGFHTGFNTLGALLVLPVAGRFSRLMQWLVRDKPSPFARRLDTALLAEPALAVAAAAATLADLAGKVFRTLAAELRGETAESQRERLELCALALAETRHYVERTPVSSDVRDVYQRQVSVLHAVDHLDRLVDRARRWDAESAAAESGLVAQARRFERALGGVDVAKDVDGAGEDELRALWEDSERDRPAFRSAVFERSARGELTTPAALERLDAYRWLRRSAYHAWRIVHHLRRALHGRGPIAPEEIAPHAEPDPAEG
ncbi:MAG: Na/Pi symporter [Proteobacteria bacterium]|nr:Na/Pi symporter [Pseudomonadota bacterium]